MRAVLGIAALCALLGAAACGHSHGAIGQLTSAGFVHGSKQYSIAYADAPSRSIMGPLWKLQNAKPPSDDGLYFKSDDFPQWEFDTDENGVTDAWVRVPSADLRFVNLAHGGVIFLRSIPLDAYEERLELDVLGAQLAQAMTGAQWYAFGSAGNERVVERRSAVLIEQTQPVTVSAVDGTAMTYSVADVDQLQMSPRARTGKMELVMLRPGFSFSLDRWTGRKPHEWFSQMMLIIGYWNTPDRFEQGRADFDGLLSRLAFHGRTAGLRRGAIVASHAAPAPAAHAEPEPVSAPEPSAEDSVPAALPFGPVPGSP